MFPGRGWALSAALFAAAGAVARTGPPSVFPPYQNPPLASHAVQDVSAVMNGARRFGGDLAFIQLLQYFGEPDPASEGKPKPQWLMEFLPRSLRFAALSPYFHGGYLYSAGVLGFVLDRPVEALALLEVGSRMDPTFFQYRLYAGAIAYQKDQSPKRVIAFLEEALKYPDCPGLLQDILAGLHKKAGNYRRAAEVYAHVIDTSRDPDAVSTARRRLTELLEKGLVQ